MTYVGRHGASDFSSNSSAGTPEGRPSEKTRMQMKGNIIMRLISRASTVSFKTISILSLATLLTVIATSSNALTQVINKEKIKSADWISIDTQSDVEFSGGDVYSLSSARLLDAKGNFWVSWDTSLALTSHDLSLINSRREQLENVRLTDISLVGDSGMFICGEQGILLESRNFGKNWSQRYFENLDYLYFYGVKFNGAGIGIVAGVTGGDDTRYRGILYRSDDAGVSWNLLEDVGGMGFSRISLDITSNTFVVTAIGSILKSSDNGVTWKTVKLPTSELMRDTKLLGSLGVSVGLKGNILRSTDAGDTWLAIKSPTKSNLTSVYLHLPSVWYIAGSGGEVWETSDGGETWKSLQLPKRVTINGIKRLGPKLIVWGADGTVMKLTL
ncbi:hypothetical protein JYT16_00605 [Gemmatimonas aurantiaca]|nr:hypothetical protein [Gemmatimonas aurantiaca]